MQEDIGMILLKILTKKTTVAGWGSRHSLEPKATAPEPSENAKGKVLFNFFSSPLLPGILDVENTPYAQDLILCGSLGSAVVGLGHFLLTGRELEDLSW